MAPGYNIFSILNFRHKKLSCPLLIVVYLLFFDFPYVLQAISFNRTDFKDWSEIKLDGYAGVINGILTLTDALKNSTNNIGTVGRAVFAKEMRLWDSSTGKIADFDTSFTFSLSSNNSYPHGRYPNMGDGFAFFLTNNGSHIPPHSEGACLGLISNCENTTLENGLVAVEFDSFQNGWENDGSGHIGINVNSINSVTARMLSGNWKDGERGNARILYDSPIKTLYVTITYLNETYSLSLPIDLSEVLPERVTFGFSAATGELKSRNEIHSWQFRSTEFPGEPLEESTEEDHDEDSSGVMDLLLVVLASFFGVFFLVSDIAAIVYYRKRTRVSKEEKFTGFDLSMDREFANGTGPKRFSFKELIRASNNFAEGGKLGEGGFGEVYKGYLRDLNLNVAIKKVSKRSKQGRKEYISEVKIISRLRHRNLVQLIGWCHENGDFLLVYEFLPNGSLDSHLFGAKTKLSWEVRYKIVLGLASALLYLHEESEQCVLHRDIKCSNIMLDSNFNAKLGDFGLARLVDEEAGLRTTGLAGTLGYMAPEYISTSKASKASDVFSFGVVVLEIACGRKSIMYNSEDDWVLLVSWVWESFGNEKLLDVVDESLCMEFDVTQMESLLTIYCKLN